jgi:hypothetical protein
LGEIQCNECHGTIAYAERYLAIDEEDGVEAEKGEAAQYCVECALQKGYAYYKGGEKGEKILTFFS